MSTFFLIPVCYTGNIILSLKQAVMAHTNLLDGHADIFLKINRIRNMEAIHASHRRTVIVVIGVVSQFILF